MWGWQQNRHTRGARVEPGGVGHLSRSTGEPSQAAACSGSEGSLPLPGRAQGEGVWHPIPEQAGNRPPDPCICCFVPSWLFSEWLLP